MKKEKAVKRLEEVGKMVRELQFIEESITTKNNIKQKLKEEMSTIDTELQYLERHNSELQDKIVSLTPISV